MAMSKKDYVAVAAAMKTEVDSIKQCLDSGAKEWYSAKVAMASVARDLAARFEADNPRFDRAKFLAACGVA